MKKVLALLITSAMLCALGFLPPSAQSQARDVAVQSTPVGRVVNSYREAQEDKPSPQKQGSRRPGWVDRALQRSLAHFKRHVEVLSLHDPETDLRLLGADQDDLGQTHLRLTQIHNGVEVFGGQLIAQLDAESVLEVFGRVFEEARIETTPHLDPAEAIEAAKAALGYPGEFASPPTAKLVVLPHRIFKGDEAPGATLVFQVELHIEDGTEATALHRYFVNAEDGSIAWRYDAMPHAIGAGRSLYSGQVNIQTGAYYYLFPHPYYAYSLEDATRGGSFVTDLNNLADVINQPPRIGTLFTKLFINAWGDGTTNNRESAAVDAHFGLMKTWDYFLNTFGRRSMSGNGMQIASRVHYGSNFNNAFYSPSSNILSYGDGDGFRFGPLVSLDVVGHEFTHGVTERTVGLIYANEPGAINESFSDIFGTAVEFYSGLNPDYLLGEDCFTPGIAGDALRSMADPTRQGDPDHYSKRLYPGACIPISDPRDPNYNDNCGVHSNSGIMNKAFYLLAEGGTHPFSLIRVPGIGRSAAEDIFYRSLAKLTPIARFSDACRATLSAAADRYGANSVQHRAMVRAWEAVGVLQPQARHSGFMVQSTFGGKGNFELVVPYPGGGLAHYYRDNDAPGLPWRGPFVFGTSAGQVDAVTMIQSNFSSGGTGTAVGNLEVMARVGDQLMFFWREDKPQSAWQGPVPFAYGISGNPALIQSRFGKVGNFELVVPRAEGGLAHYYRDNDAAGLPWRGPFPFGVEAGKVDAVALLQSNFSAGAGIGNFEVIARIGDRLAFFWKEDAPPYTWRGPVFFLSGVTGNPALIQSRFGANGNFEMIVPLAAGGLAHYSRDNDVPGLPWRGPFVFGTSVGRIDAVTMIQSNFSAGAGVGNLEVVARVGNQLALFWLEDRPFSSWQGPGFF